MKKTLGITASIEIENAIELDNRIKKLPINTSSFVRLLVNAALRLDMDRFRELTEAEASQVEITVRNDG